MYSLGSKLIAIDWIFYFSLLKETHLVWVEALTTMLANNPVFLKIN